MTYNDSIRNISPIFEDINTNKEKNISQNNVDISIFPENNSIQHQYSRNKIEFDDETKTPFINKNLKYIFNSIKNKSPLIAEYMISDRNTGEQYRLIEQKTSNIHTSLIKDIHSGERVQFNQNSYYDDNSLANEYSIQYLGKGELIQSEKQYNQDGSLSYDKYTYINQDNNQQDYIYNFYNNGDESQPSSTKIKKGDTIVEYNYQEDGSLSNKDLYRLSDEGEILSHSRTDKYGNTQQLSSSSYNDDGSFQTNKSFTSPNGTETNYAYKKDSDGSSTLIYNIVDKNGNVLLDTTRTYEKISDNEAISTYNNKKYHINIDDSIITVSDLSNKEATQINLDRLVEDSEKNITLREDEDIFISSSDNEDFKEMIKQQPGDVLINMAEELNKVGKLKFENGIYSPVIETIASSADEHIFNHELGHAIDDIPVGEVDSAQISNTEEFLEVFEAEKEQFLETASDSQIDTAKYLLDSQEFAAEARMLTTTSSPSERAEILQEYFPKSAAYINILMDCINQVDTRKQE